MLDKLILWMCRAAAPVETTNRILNKKNAHVSYLSTQGLRSRWNMSTDGANKMEKTRDVHRFQFLIRDIYQSKLLGTRAKIKFYIRTKN